MADEPTTAPCGWMKLWHPRGVLVTLPVILGTPEEMFRGVDGYLDAGWLPREVGLEAGEEKDDVAFVVHGQSEGRDGSTDFLLLYSANDAYKWSFLKVYLNKPEDVAAFEAVSGVRLQEIPVYIGQDKPERGKNKNVDKFIIPIRRPFGVVYKHNPKWTEEGAAAAKSKNEMYTVPKRIFVRWADQKASQPASAQDRPEGGEFVTPGQVGVLKDTIEIVASYGRKINPIRFAQVFGGTSLETIPANRFADAKAELERVGVEAANAGGGR